jgi:hypothetical protein
VPEDAHVTVLLRLGPGATECAVVVPSGTPAGGVWGHLPREFSAGGPPDGVRYLLNGLRTIPGAPLRDGDTLVVAPPTHEEIRHAPS